MKIIAATGHRPDKLGGYCDDVRTALRDLAIDYLKREEPDKVITGMALGWDQAMAYAAFALKIPFVASIPFAGQHLQWPALAQKRYLWLLNQAAETVVVSQPSVHVSRAMQLRNQWMVDRAEKIVALWDGSLGGTANCIKYAEKKCVPVENIWICWLSRKELLSTKD